MLLAYTAVKLHILHIFKGEEERKKKNRELYVKTNLSEMQIIPDTSNILTHRKDIRYKNNFFFSLKSYHWHESIVIFSTGM